MPRMPDRWRAAVAAAVALMLALTASFIAVGDASTRVSSSVSADDDDCCQRADDDVDACGAMPGCYYCAFGSGGENGHCTAKFGVPCATLSATAGCMSVVGCSDDDGRDLYQGVDDDNTCGGAAAATAATTATNAAAAAVAPPCCAHAYASAMPPAYEQCTASVDAQDARCFLCGVPAGDSDGDGTDDTAAAVHWQYYCASKGPKTCDDVYWQNGDVCVEMWCDTSADRVNASGSSVNVAAIVLASAPVLVFICVIVFWFVPNAARFADEMQPQDMDAGDMMMLMHGRAGSVGDAHMAVHTD